jgi:uncharacterized membrane protein YphA (DoxX/SURF4 family)
MIPFDLLHTLQLIFIKAYGIYWLYTGINGLFSFRKPPPASPEFNEKIEHLYSLRFLMPSVKTLEVICGVFLIFGFKPILALFVLCPILFGIVGLQILFNKKYFILISTLSFAHLYCFYLLRANLFEIYLLL